VSRKDEKKGLKKKKEEEIREKEREEKWAPD